jgi:iron(III) transport system permease protein
VLIAIDVNTAGWSKIHRDLFRHRTAVLLSHTVVLSALVVVLAAVLGVAAAWCTERTDLPARRLWTVLLVLPVAMPDFVVGYAWHTAIPHANPLAASTLVMSLTTYPLVYLPVAAALRRADPAMEETARSLGVSRVETFRRVTLPLITPAVIGGALLVVLTIVSEYGVFEILRYFTFTTEVFNDYKFGDATAAAALSVPLVIIGLLVLVLANAPRRSHDTAVAARRNTSRARLPWKGAPVTAALAAIVVLAIGVPVSALCYWIIRAQRTTLPAAATLGTATGSTLVYSALGAAVAVVGALPVALMTTRRTTVARAMVERSTYVSQALPGIVVALSLVFFTFHYAYRFHNSATLLVVAYAIMHFPLALVCVKTSAAQAPTRLADVGRSLGRGPLSVFLRVTLPLLGPGLAAGFCLVFLTATTELTATLVLAPIGVHTLATQFWAFQTEAAYSAAAPYALVIVAIAVIPGALLGLYFDRAGQSRETAPA